ncbi:APC family permease [Mycolicibacterium sp. GCM10028919]|uniref:APC family permease n=1 Tax=Mycolicibacterium sp. GCM10028919 TaxID=3273401 RepID=UPI00361CC662
MSSEPLVGISTDPQEGTLKRALGVPSLTLFGLVYMVPLTVFTTYGIVTVESGGRVPLAYIVTLAAMIFTARSYARMAAAFPVAGSAYAYTQKTFGAPIGFLAGWSLLLDYLFLPMLNYLVIGLYLNAAVPSIPEWAIVLVTIAIVTVLNIVGIVSVARANMLIIAIQAVFVVVFLVMAVAAITGSGSVDVMAPFRGDGTAGGMAPVLAGAAILCLSFLGFDAVSTLSEEAKDARRDVPKAIMLATLICGVLFVILSYASQLVFPSNAFEDVDSGSLDVMQAAGGAFMAAFFTAAYVAGALGSALTSQASVARILYAMGRDGVLPRKVFGHVSVKFSTPTWAIIVISVISLLAVWIDLALLASVVSFGALVAFSAVNLTVIKHYFVDEGEKNVLNNLILPFIGFALTVWLWTSLSSEALTVGLIWSAIGLVWLAVVTHGFRRPTPVLDMEETSGPVAGRGDQAVDQRGGGAR